MAESARKQMQDTSIDTRLTRLETTTGHIQQDVSELKTNLAQLSSRGFAVAVLILSAMATGFFYLSSRQDHLTDNMNGRFEAMNSRFDAMNAQQHKMLEEIHALATDVAKIKSPAP